MVVHTRARALLEWWVPLSAKFPREHRNGVARHTVVLAMRVHDALVAARHHAAAERKLALQQADIALDQLRQYQHLAWRWRWISEGQLQHAGSLTEELGRLIGGWLRSLPAPDRRAAGHDKPASEEGAAPR